MTGKKKRVTLCEGGKERDLWQKEYSFTASEKNIR